jgi:hypothetical protein
MTDRAGDGDISSASWMIRLDERVLRTFQLRGPLRLSQLMTYLGPVGPKPDDTMDFVLFRCRELRQHGFLTFEDGGYYRLTNRGRSFLEGCPLEDGSDDERAAGSMSSR